MLNVPLSVRMKTARGDRHVTAQARDLEFSKAALGGFKAASLELDRPIRLDAEEIRRFGTMTVYDRRSAAPVWSGRIDAPGVGAGPGGEVRRVTATGHGPAHVQDRSAVLIYVDRSLERWEVYQTSSRIKNAEDRIDEDSNGSPVVKLAAPRGTVWADNKVVSRAYRYLSDNGLSLGAFNASGDCGKTTSGIWRWEIVIRGSATVARTVDFTTGGIAASQLEVGDSFTEGDDLVEIRIRQINATTQTVADDDTWTIFANVYVMMQMVNELGTLLGTSYNYGDGSVLGHEVVKDLLGRLLPKFDGASAEIDTSWDYAIDQLAYVDRAKPGKVFEDLVGLDSRFLWQAWELLSNGKARFVWKKWPTSVRYEATSVDGLDTQASGREVYNRVIVRWRDARGRIKNTVRTSVVDELTDAGLTREEPLDLGDEVGTLAAAQRRGDEFLSQHGLGLASGTLMIARPVRDLVLGTMVEPFEVVPGELIRVRDVVPRVAPLFATAQDGQSVFRLIDTTYRASSHSVACTLDSPPRKITRQPLPEQRRR